jgi:PAS domain S-box-containing protein
MVWLATALGAVAAAALALWLGERGRRRRGEAAGRDSEARFSAAFQGAGVGMALVEADGRLADFNDALCRMIGRDRAALAGRRFQELLHPDDQAEGAADFAALVRGERDRYDVERRYVRPDGAARHVRYAVTAIRDGAGRLRHAVAVVEDLTDRDELQLRLAGADRMASLGALAAGVAHELNNPLSYVAGNLAYARESLAGAATTPEALALARQALDEAHEGAARVRQIVGDLRALSRPGGDRREPVDVAAAVRSALNLASGALRNRARAVVELGPVPPVAGDPARFGQVVLNLVVNAAQAIPEGHPEANEVRLAAALEPDGRVRLDVSDTGSGIPPEVLPHIFDPFFSTKAHAEGTGLGLAISQRTVAAMGGQITVRTAPGAGTTMTVLLPAAPVASRPLPASSLGPAPARPRAEAELQGDGRPAARVEGSDPARRPREAGAASADPPPDGARALVLVVDDEPYVGRTMRRILGARHEVEVLESAERALERLASPPAPDVILCDLMMPGVTGMELHARLLERDPAAAARMVFVTGGALHEAARRFLAAVPNPVLEKPFATDLLRAVVAETLRRGLAALPAGAAAQATGG